jgi:hypothetical protein
MQELIHPSSIMHPGHCCMQSHRHRRWHADRLLLTLPGLPVGRASCVPCVGMLMRFLRCDHLLALAMVAYCAAVGGADGGAQPKRWVSYWYSPAHTADDKEPSHNVTATLELLKREGGSKVATSLMLYCGDSIRSDGTFSAGVSVGCDVMIPELNAMDIGAERIVGSPSIDNLRAMFQSPTKSIAGMVALAKKHKLRGVSWDVEPPNSTKSDAMKYAAYLKQLRAALAPLGVRLTTYNNQYNPVISDMDDIQHSVDRLLDGDTYNYRCDGCVSDSQNFTGWLKHYHATVVNSNISRDKAGVSMLASTERGDWNCKASTMKERLAQIKADAVPELAIFILRPDEGPDKECSTKKLNPDGEPMCPCSNKWFPLAREFLAETL